MDGIDDGLDLCVLVTGSVAGFIARALVPGKDAIPVGGTIVLGVVGSFIGGFIGYALTHEDSTEGAFQSSGLIGSVVGAIIALLIYRAIGTRHLV